MNNKVAGVYATEEEAKQAVEQLEQEGYRAEEISLVVNESTSTSLLRREKDVQIDTARENRTSVEGPETPFWEKVKAVFQGQTDFSGDGGSAGSIDLTKYGLTEAAAQEYEADVNNGRILIVVPEAGNDSPPT